jgi:hypothetical protein
MQHLRLTHPAHTFWVDVTVHERDGRFMSTADLAENTPQEAVRAALRALGEPYLGELPEGVGL